MKHPGTRGEGLGAQRREARPLGDGRPPGGDPDLVPGRRLGVQGVPEPAVRRQPEGPAARVDDDRLPPSHPFFRARLAPDGALVRVQMPQMHHEQPFLAGVRPTAGEDAPEGRGSLRLVVVVGPLAHRPVAALPLPPPPNGVALTMPRPLQSLVDEPHKILKGRERSGGLTARAAMGIVDGDVGGRIAACRIWKVGGGGRGGSAGQDSRSARNARMAVSRSESMAVASSTARDRTGQLSTPPRRCGQTWWRHAMWKARAGRSGSARLPDRAAHRALVAVAAAIEKKRRRTHLEGHRDDDTDMGGGRGGGGGGSLSSQARALECCTVVVFFYPALSGPFPQ